MRDLRKAIDDVRAQITIDGKPAELIGRQPVGYLLERAGGPRDYTRGTAYDFWHQAEQRGVIARITVGVPGRDLVAVYYEYDCEEHNPQRGGTGRFEFIKLA